MIKIYAFLILVLIGVFSVILLTYIIKQLKKHNIRPNFQVKPDDEYELKGAKANNFFAEVNIKNIMSLEELVKEHIILIFINSTCPHCSPNFSIFLNEVSKYQFINFALVISEKQKEEMKNYYELYDDINILSVSEEVFTDFKIRAFPFYIYIDSFLEIKEATPIPYKILSQLGSLQMVTA
jgi:hypothetical protein